MRNRQQPGRSPVMATEAMAATSQPMATEAALQILRNGGNAMDAAIAAHAVLTVVEPQSTGIGGDGFILYHEAASGKLHGLNGSGRAAAAASADDLRRRGFETMPQKGIHAVTVPGSIDAWFTASETLGKLGFDAVLQPAIHYAKNGYAVSPIVGYVWDRHESFLAQTPEASAAYLVDGKAPAIGSIHRQPDLARSLKIIAERGRDGFYTGEIADEIIRFSDSHEGTLTHDDLANHQSEWVEPISTDYRGHELFEIPPNGQGLAALIMLNILRQTELAQHTHLGPDHVHLLSEAFSLAIAERDRFVSDMAFNDLPIADLLSDEFAAKQFARIDMDRALPQPRESVFPDNRNTVYLTVVDRDRNACSFINSTYDSFGSGLVAGNTGICLHNRGYGFNLIDGHFNCLEGGKRPMHTIIPAMVYRDGKPVLSFGVMGAHYQAMGQAYVLTNMVDYGMDIQQAIDAARFTLYDRNDFKNLRNSENITDKDPVLLAVESGMSEATRESLEARGHRVAETEKPHGGGQGIVIDWEAGVLHGGSDPRKDGCAAGY